MVRAASTCSIQRRDKCGCSNASTCRPRVTRICRWPSTLSARNCQNRLALPRLTQRKAADCSAPFVIFSGTRLRAGSRGAAFRILALGHISLVDRARAAGSRGFPGGLAAGSMPVSVAGDHDGQAHERQAQGA